ncbi:MAG: YcxB family protein [Kangiella sp.]|nr:YcxB family protein [Kangiella sp.]
MKIEGVVSESDFLRSQYLHIRPHPAFSVAGVILCLLAVLLLIISFSWLLFACLMYLTLHFFVLIPWRVKKVYREYSAIQEPTSISFSDEGLEFSSENGKSLFPWSDIRKIKKNNSLILIYPNRINFHLIPSHFFNSKDEFDDFSTLIDSKYQTTK